MVIVNSHKAAVDLMEKRSSIYSNRPPLQSAGLIGYTNTLPMVPYGDRLREQRRMLSQTFGSRALTDKFGPLEEHEVHTLLLRILREPSSEHILEHIKRFVLALYRVIHLVDPYRTGLPEPSFCYWVTGTRSSLTAMTLS